MTSLVSATSLAVYTAGGHASAGLRVDTADGSTVWAAVPLGEDDARRWKEPEPPGLRLRAEVGALAPRLLEGREVSSQDELDASIDAETEGLDPWLCARVRYLLSVAAARACAADRGVPLHAYLAGAAGREPDRGLPAPAVALLCGGVGVRSVMAVPDGAPSLPEAVRAAAEITASLGALMRERGEPYAIGDEGGYRARFEGARAADRLGAALGLAARAVESAGYALGAEVKLALDVGARHGRVADAAELCERAADQVPLRFIEDPLDPSALEAARALRDRLRAGAPGRPILAARADAVPAAEAGPWDALLIAPDRIGTVSSTLECVARTRAAGAVPIASARTGETEDVFVADLAAALALPLIEAGGVQRSDRAAKYNQLLRVAERYAPGPALEPGCLGGAA